jgi:hypothetical protein
MQNAKKSENLSEVYNSLVTEVEYLQELSYDSVKELMAFQAEKTKATWNEVGNLVAIRNKLKELTTLAKAETAKLKSGEELENV